jgi:deazaflavin-dependent oxidoreductase (nitroreductase family)
MLLLTTTGRKSGRQVTTPIFYLGDGDRLIICNVRPAHERVNPWTVNIRATPQVTVEVGATKGPYLAREATDVEIDRYWPQLVALWPAYQEHYERGGKRSIFVLEYAVSDDT